MMLWQNRDAVISDEVWMAVVLTEWPECTAFEVSSLGRVRRVVPSIRGKALQNEILTQQWTGNAKYNSKRLRVRLAWQGKRLDKKVHRLVCVAFHGPQPSPDHEVAHFPERDPANNTAVNLSWRTKSENASHRYVHGTAPPRRLTPEQVRDVRQRYQAGEGLNALARAVGVEAGSMWGVLNRRTYKDIPEEPRAPGAAR